ncbi:MAG: lamin tail domain-containing protein [bacterium]|nr:lamin tail domain-containing protein [bacterium]
MSSHCRKSSRLRPWLPVGLLAALWLAAGAAVAAPAAVADHVVFSQVVTVANTATNRPLCSEYVALHNPTGAAIDLGQYYLTDATFSTSNQYYWKITQPDPSATTAGGGGFADFHAKFPAGYQIAAGDTIVIAIGGSNAYQAAYGRLPDFELYEDAAAPDGVPDLVEVFPGSVGGGVLNGSTNTPTLTDNAESLVLYRWDGASDLVQDVDFARWGALTVTNTLFDKTGVTVGASTYLADTPPASQQTISATALAFGNAYARLSADEGTEATSGGNGLTGHNETSENFPATWQTAPQDPPLAPASFFAAAPVITAHGQSPATPVIGEAVTVSVTVLSSTVVTGVAFRYTVDGGLQNELSGTAAGDIWSAVIPAQAEGAVVRWHAVATNAAGGSGTYPDAAPRFASTWTVIAPPPPTITAFAVSPAAPYADLPATLSVTANSISALTGAVFHYRVDGGAFAQLAGAAQGGGVYTVTVPGQGNGAVVDWYVVVANAALLSASSPADAPATTHTWTVGAAPDPKLLLTEVCTIGSDQEFIEIWNPSPQAVDLSDYYLSDAIFTRNGTNTGYWNLPGAVLSSDTVGGGAFSDFTARFPDGFTIAAGDTITVSLAGSLKFTNSYTFPPDIELYEDDAFPDGVPDMRSVFPTGSSIITDPVASLTNGGEVVIFFRWSEGDPLVTDVDIFFYGAGTDHLFSKTGRTVGGATYAPETAVANLQPYSTAAIFGQSYQRVDASEGSQVLTGSNGVDGRDELSEPWVTTWTLAAPDPARPGSGGAAGDGAIAMVVPAQTFIPSLGETFPVKITSRPRSETRLRLFDREGRLVRSLFDSRFNGPPSTTPGSFTTIPWNGLDETLQRVPSGLYVVHLSVVDKATGVEETRTAPVVVTTRLSR